MALLPVPPSALTSTAIATAGGALAQSPLSVYAQVAHLAPTFAAKLANVIAGTGACKVACLGDSTTAGQGSVADGITGCYAYSWPAYLSRLYTNIGLPATISSKWGDQGNVSQGSTVPTYDGRVTQGSGWTYNSSFESIGGYLLTSAGTGTWSFTPTDQWDKVDIYYITGVGGGTVSANIDGGAGTTINTNAATGRTKVTVTASGGVGTHTLNLVGVSGTAYIIGVDCYNSSTPQMRLYQMGRRSGTLTSIDTANSNYNPLNCLRTIAPDLTIINLGANDAHYVISPASSATSLSNIVTAARVSGDVLFVTFLPGQSTFATLADQAATYAAIVAQAKALNVPIVDINKYRIAFNSPQAIGNSFYFDQIHQTKSGYADMARTIKSGMDAF